MNTGKTFQDFASFNCFNRNNFLEKLEIARRDDPFHEPEACRLLRLHCAGAGNFLACNFEPASPLHPRLPVRFAESLFILRNEKGQKISSLDVLNTLKETRPDLHLLSRFRFWQGFASAEYFFNAFPAYTHLSLNIPPRAAKSERFAEHFEQGVQLFEKAFPGKGLILEMLEQEPWGEAQRISMDRLKNYNISWAVDDYGADDGAHDITSLKLVREYSVRVPPLVKVDGSLLKKTLRTHDPKAFVTRMKEVEAVCPKALLVFEWMDHATELRELAFLMHTEKLRLRIHFAQSHSITAEELAKAEKLFSPPKRPDLCRHKGRITRAASFHKS